MPDSKQRWPWKSILAVIFIFLMAFGSVVNLLGSVVGVFPTDEKARWLMIGAIAILSGAVAVTTTRLHTSTLHDVKTREMALEKGMSNLRKRLTPLVKKGLEDLLKEKQQKLTYDFKQNEWTRMDAALFVFMEFDTIFHIVACTAQDAAPVRRLALSKDEGVIGCAIKVEAPVIASYDSSTPGPVLNTRGVTIAQQSPLEDHNRNKLNQNLQWIYGEPIYETPPDKPWAKRIIGILTVDSCDTDAKEKFLLLDFQTAIHQVASELEPYLLAIRTILEPAD